MENSLLPATNVLSLFADPATSTKGEREIRSALSAKLDTNASKVGIIFYPYINSHWISPTHFSEFEANILFDWQVVLGLKVMRKRMTLMT